MECTGIKSLILRKIDHEISESESRILDAHMEQCSECCREYNLLSIPSRISKEITPLEASPYFFQKLKVRIENEAQNVALVQMFFGLARRIIPSMAAITLALLSTFTYLHLSSPQDDLYAAYEKVFIGEDMPFPMMATGQQDITDASILSAIANQATQQNVNIEQKQ